MSVRDAGPLTLTKAEWHWLRGEIIGYGRNWARCRAPYLRRSASIVAKADAVCGPLNPRGYSAESHRNLFAALAALDAAQSSAKKGES